MTLEGFCEHFGSLDPKPYPVILDGRDRRLGDAGEFCKFSLAEILKLPDDPDGFAHRNFDCFFGFPVIPHNPSRKCVVKIVANLSQISFCFFSLSIQEIMRFPLRE